MACGWDSLSLADEDRENQEFHELAFSSKGEADLEKGFNCCNKNPGHLKFISPHNLDLLPLPGKFKCFRSLQLIKHLADMTVKLSVTFISPKRPCKFPYSKYAGQRKLLVGSGCVTDIDEDIKCVPCPFEDCDETLGKHQVYGYITVVTAAHVVCDDVEARNTTVEFFYDFADCKTNVRRARGVKVGTVSTKGDFCQLLCVVHDKLPFKTMGRKTFEDPSYHSERKVAPVVLNKNIYFGYKTLGGISLRRPLRDIVGLSGDKEKWPCPFKDCREVFGAHEVYGYICVEVAVDVLGEEGVQSPERLHVGVDCDIPGYRPVYLKIRGVKFGSASMLGSSRELLCVVHDRALFELIKYLLRGDQKIYLHHRFMSYCDIVFDIFKDRLQIERLFLCVHYEITLCGKIECENSKSVDTLMSLVGYTIPNIEEAFYFHACSDACIVDKSISVKVRRTLDTARHHMDGIIGFLGHYHPCLIGQKFEMLRLQLGELLAEDPFTSSLEEEWFGTRVRQEYKIMRRELQILLAKDPISMSSLNNFFERIARQHPGKTNELLVTSINKKVLSLLVHFQDGFNLSDIIEDCRVSSDINEDDDDHIGDDDADNDTLLVHICHPHGRSKHITTGKLTQCDTGDGFYHSLYTASTCPGSSGGPVWVIPASADLGQVYGVPHSGCHGNQLSQGSSWTLYPS